MKQIEVGQKLSFGETNLRAEVLKREADMLLLKVKVMNSQSPDYYDIVPVRREGQYDNSESIKLNTVDLKDKDSPWYDYNRMLREFEKAVGNIDSSRKRRRDNENHSKVEGLKFRRDMQVTESLASQRYAKIGSLKRLCEKIPSDEWLTNKDIASVTADVNKLDVLMRYFKWD